MNNTNTGDKAFPAVVVYQNQVVYEGGMTLRDYFAAKAMQSFVAAWIAKSAYPETDLELAEHAYAMADAMLLAREEA
jgi:hypothetical protein